MKRTRTAIALALACALAALAAPGALAAESWEPVGAAIGDPNPKPAGLDLKRIGGAPTVAYTHWNGTNREIRVARFGPDGWKPVGTQVNADPTHDATTPSLAAGPGDIPWIAWLEADDDGVTQVRVARFSASKNRFVEPVGGSWPIQPRPPQDRVDDWFLYRGVQAKLVFVGSRAHLVYRTEGVSEYVLRTARLADDRRSWRSVGSPPRYIPYGSRAHVMGGRLHAGTTDFGTAAYVDRLDPSGWTALGRSVNESFQSPDGYPYEGGIASMANLGGTLYAAWNGCCDDAVGGRVARFVGDAWQDVAGPADPDGVGTLRAIGGRLWVTAGSAPLRRLADDGSSWIASPALAGASRVGLTGVGGTPHVAWLDSSGRVNVAKLTGVAPAGADDTDDSDPPCAQADADIARPVPAPPPPAKWPPTDAVNSADTSCANIDTDPAGHEDPSGGNPGQGDPDGGNPGNGTPGTGNPGGGSPGADHPTVLSQPTPGPCGLRLLGTARGDRLTGDGLRNELVGRSGNDTILGLGGADCLFGNAGNDVLKGGAGADRLEGGSGRDRLVGGAGNDRVVGGPGNDVIDSRASGFDTIDCGPGRDRALVGDLDRVRNCERVVNAD